MKLQLCIIFFLLHSVFGQVKYIPSALKWDGSGIEKPGYNYDGTIDFNLKWFNTIYGITASSNLNVYLNGSFLTLKYDGALDIQVLGLGLLPTFPSSLVISLDAGTLFSFNISNFDPFDSASISGSIGIAGLTVYNIQERSSGTNQRPPYNLAANYCRFLACNSYNAGNDTDVKYSILNLVNPLQLPLKELPLNTSVQVAMISSNKIVPLNYPGGNPLLAPNTIETTITVNNYEYLDANSYLEVDFLIFGFKIGGSVAIDYDITGRVLGSTDPRFYFSDVCYDENGNSHTVTITKKNFSVTVNPEIATFFGSTGNKVPLLYLVNVKFPPGLKNIYYDPSGTVGNGSCATTPTFQSLYGVPGCNQQDSVSKQATYVSAIIAVVVIVAVVAIFITVFAFRKKIAPYITNPFRDASKKSGTKTTN